MPNGSLATLNPSPAGLAVGLFVLACFTLPMPPLQQE